MSWAGFKCVEARVHTRMPSYLTFHSCITVPGVRTSCMCKRTRPCPHTHTYPSVRCLAGPCQNTHICTQAHTPVRWALLVHVRTHTCTHTCTVPCRSMSEHTHARTHTCTVPCRSMSKPLITQGSSTFQTDEIWRSKSSVARNCTHVCVGKRICLCARACVHARTHARTRMWKVRATPSHGCNCI